MKEQKTHWVIAVGKGYGHFLFEGTEKEAEEMKCLKAITEEAISKKRLATKEEVKSRIIDQCNNHPGYNNQCHYFCMCSKVIDQCNNHPGYNNQCHYFCMCSKCTGIK